MQSREVLPLFSSPPFHQGPFTPEKQIFSLAPLLLSFYNNVTSLGKCFPSNLGERPKSSILSARATHFHFPPALTLRCVLVDFGIQLNSVNSFCSSETSLLIFGLLTAVLDYFPFLFVSEFLVLRANRCSLQAQGFANWRWVMASLDLQDLPATLFTSLEATWRPGWSFSGRAGNQTF